MRTHKNRPINVLILVVLLALVLANSKTVSSPFRMKIADSVSVPISYAKGIKGFLSGISPWKTLSDENKALRAQNEILARQLDEAKTLVSENERLRELLDFRKSTPYTTIPAQVIGRDPTNWSNSIIIDKGSTAGLKVNKAVISTKGLVGRVLELGRYSAKVLLITDPNSKVGVLIQRNGQGGMMVGRPDGNCKMLYIALDSDVRSGDKIISAGFGSIYPKGILVGEVTKVERESGRLYKCAVIRPAQDMAKLEEVLCIR
ncbi:MAG TPA: rod shape-determining protein MreC [Candidatus Omnitrophota bacterium]|nr:rod shape-determining protein MreC [Candidatus Omnitrophota bacterium]